MDTMSAAPAPLPWMTSFQARVYRHPAFRNRIALPRRGDLDGCWLWTAGRATAGYGRVRFGPATWYAHRLSRFVAFGDEPEAACHSCDNPPCVNPEHLRAGTRSDNSREMWAKGRQGVFGKLSQAQVDAIRGMFASGGAARLAAEYGVSRRTIYRVVMDPPPASAGSRRAVA